MKSIVFFCLVACSLISCSNPAARSDAKAPGDNINQLIDTTKLKSDLSDVLSSISSGKPDTTKLKAANQLKN